MEITGYQIEAGNGPFLFFEISERLHPRDKKIP
jgi:hypothetical protein